MYIIILICEALLLCSALSIDCFVTGFSYGANKIKITMLPALVINMVCSSVLALSLFLGDLIGKYIPSGVTLAICVTILTVMGVSKILSSVFRAISKKKAINKNLAFSLFSLRFYINILGAPEEADLDRSKTLSIFEAFIMAVALSLDGLAVGVTAGLMEPTLTAYLIIIGVSLLTDFTFIRLGGLLGNRVAQKSAVNLSWLSGLFLIGLAVMKFFI